MNLVYATLSSLAYPIFNAKISTVDGAENLPPAGGYVIAANHVDWLDGFYIAAVVGSTRDIPVHFLTKTKNYWWTTVAIQIPTERHGAIVDTAVEALQRGQVICNFPEGQRSTGAQLQPGKTGTVRMAALANVPVVPLGISLPDGKTMRQSILNIMTTGREVTIRFGTPLHFALPAGGMTETWLTTETRRLMAAIAPLAGKHV